MENKLVSGLVFGVMMFGVPGLANADSFEWYF